MKTRITFGTIVMMAVIALTAHATGKGTLQNYFNDAAIKVKATENTTEKRTILSNSFQSMSKSIDMVKRSPLVSASDAVGLDRMEANLSEKSSELAGTNGFTRVPDNQLNAFSDYAVQDMEQADQVITISLVTLLLLLILFVVLVK